MRLLLGFARRRARARAERRQRLAAQRGGDSLAVGFAAFAQLVLVFCLHGCSASLLSSTVVAAQHARADAAGRVVVSPWLLESLERSQAEGRPVLPEAFRGEARRTEADGNEAYELRLRAHFERYGLAGLEAEKSGWRFARDPQPIDAVARLLGSLVILGWFAMLAFQGEGVEIDSQRQRHPMWEWLLGHPVDARAVFLAEMLAPLAANPHFWAGPVFWVGAFWIAYDDFGLALVAGPAAGIPLCVAAGCFGKALEIVAMLRLSPRTRGAALGLLGWVGQAGLMLMVLAALTPALPDAAARHSLRLLGGVSLPVLDWTLGLLGSPSPFKGVLACWLTAAVLIAVAMQVAAQATRDGLAGAFGGAPAAPAALAEPGRSRFLRDPAYRKELLWLWRDRGALIQVILVPLSFAAWQLFNLRGLLVKATGAWHLMAGASVVFGTYFLMVLGPRSLLSEGSALWIPLTWPRGLEELLKAKARLFWTIALVLVGPLMLFTALRFPADAWKVALVFLLFAAFGRSVVEKAVTLVSAPSSSGEPEPVSQGRRWAANLGLLSFGVGILTQQWQLAILGLVYSWLTAAALWQNFRARLPFLFDPWSERAPEPPTLMHAMIAISAMIEAVAVLSALLLGAGAFFGEDAPLMARSIAYGICALGTWVVTSQWLLSRGVQSRHVWLWERAGARRLGLARGLLVALGLGLALGAAGLGYTALLRHAPQWGEAFRQTDAYLAAHPGGRGWIAVMAIGFAPVAEEYLFRGLLFRALDREWGGARAIWGSACFFAIYHPPEAWLPVVLVGAASALLFKRVGWLLPSVILHAIYNAVVVLAP